MDAQIFGFREEYGRMAETKKLTEGHQAPDGLGNLRSPRFLFSSEILILYCVGTIFGLPFVGAVTVFS
jgi:hypothetical protein